MTETMWVILASVIEILERRANMLEVDSINHHFRSIKQVVFVDSMESYPPIHNRVSRTWLSHMLFASARSKPASDDM